MAGNGIAARSRQARATLKIQDYLITMSNHLKFLVAVLALAGSGIVAQAGESRMVTIQAGTLPRQDQQPIDIKLFQLANRELTRCEWLAVRFWALENGYDLGPCTGETPDHPASTITWYDAVKFCNAASELAGLTPVYYTSPEQDNVYRQGELDLSEACVNADADGYRLPTEWEWEYACRAGTTTPYWYGAHSEPQPDNPYAWHTINDARGEYVSPHPVGLKKANPFGLYDMHGNVAEWTWNRYGDLANWRGQRGGSVALDNDVTADFRSPVPPAYRVYDVGLRLASTSPDCPPLDAAIAANKLPPPQDIPPLKQRYDHTDPAAVAAELVALLNPQYSDIQPVIELQRSGKPQEALEIYRDILVGRLATAPGINHRPPQAPKDAAAIADWFAKQEITATTAKTNFDNLDNAGRAAPNSYQAPITWDFGMGFGNNSLKWLDIIRQIVSKPPADISPSELVPARALANMVIFAATDDIARPLKDPRNCVGNQQIHVASILVKQARLLPEMRDAGAWETLGTDRLENGAIARFILPDGGDLEQSFNYNNSLFPTYDSIAELFADRETPEWVERLHQLALDRKRMMNALRLASGTAPNVGNNSYGRDMGEKSEAGDEFHDSLVASILDQLVHDNQKQLKPPAFTSIAFPYSGYYLMRNGWDAESSSLFFKSSRPGAGHNHPDNNGIELAAYGRHLLVGRESPPYQDGHLPDDQKQDYLWISEYKGEAARWGANVLLIDGCGQLPGANNVGYSTAIPDQPWFKSEPFDFVQGHWTRTFKGNKPMDADRVLEQARKHGADAETIARQMEALEKHNARPPQAFDATHTRQVIYLRHANAWIVTDWAEKVKGPGEGAGANPPSSLTQLWNFPAPGLSPNRSFAARNQNQHPLHPGFEEAHVTPDDLGQRVVTTNPDNVNLAILHAVPGEIGYTTYFGEKYPWRGWANEKPSMVSGYVPAVDLHATFAGGGPIVTLLVPIPEGQSYDQRVVAFNKNFDGGQTRIRVEFSDGTKVEYVVANQPAKLTAGPVVAEAEALLTLTRDGVTDGLAIAREGGGYAFDVVDGKMQRRAEITVPSGFEWKESAGGLVPAIWTEKRP
jgi:formylglycine-generating enzyme required for sulfatase activity